MTDEATEIDRLAVPVDSREPSVNTMALVEVARHMCLALDKGPIEGALLLMAAAAFIVDAQCAEWSEEEGREQDGLKTVNTYMHTSSKAWNAFLVMFKGVDPQVFDFDQLGEEMQRPKETLQ